MTDLQSTHKNFLFEIEEVGIKNLIYPLISIVSKRRDDLAFQRA